MQFIRTFRRVGGPSAGPCRCRCLRHHGAAFHSSRASVFGVTDACIFKGELPRIISWRILVSKHISQVRKQRWRSQLAWRWSKPASQLRSLVLSLLAVFTAHTHISNHQRRPSEGDWLGVWSFRKQRMSTTTQKDCASRFPDPTTRAGWHTSVSNDQLAAAVMLMLRFQ